MARETALAQDFASLAFRARRLVIALVACLSLASSPVLAQSPAAQRDLTFVRVHCAQCHAIDKAVIAHSPSRPRSALCISRTI
jgi:mono/diheme cytochrome c family protein